MINPALLKRYKPCFGKNGGTQLSHLVKEIHSQAPQKFVRKGDRGRILVVGGSELYVGAPFLAANAAMTLADLVTIAAPEKVAWAINLMSPDLMTRKLPGKIITKKNLLQIRSIRRDVTVIGNGMGDSDAIPSLLRMPGKKVVDADAFRHAKLTGMRNAIFTPHRGETVRLFQNEGFKSGIIPAIEIFERNLLDRKDCRKDFLLLDKEIRIIQWKLGTNVLLIKGSVDIVISRTHWKFNVTGHPRMAVGGTGDVLAGLCGGFYATEDAFEAACDAAFLNGLTGERLAKKNPNFLASDFISQLPFTLKDLMNAESTI